MNDYGSDRGRTYTRATLPAPCPSATRYAYVSNPEAGRKTEVRSDASGWKYMDDGSAVTIA